MNTAFVSVIIPVFNDSDRLRRCLEALSQQTVSNDYFEIIVVDNGSTDNVVQVIQHYPQVILISESQPGSYAARNKGIATAKGNILAFTDADCIPDPSWLENGIKYLAANPHCGIAAGKIKFFFQQPGAPNIVEIYDSAVHLRQEQYVKEQWGATANLFTTPAVVNKVGLFNTDLKSGGDLEWGKRVSAQGYTVSYVLDSIVAHPARSSLQEMRQKMIRRVGGGYMLNHLHQNHRPKTLMQFSQKLLIKLRPPIRSAIRKSFLNQKVKHYRHQIIVFSMVFILHYLEFPEFLRLQIGGEPVRQ